MQTSCCLTTFSTVIRESSSQTLQAHGQEQANGPSTTSTDRPSGSRRILWQLSATSSFPGPPRSHWYRRVVGLRTRDSYFLKGCELGTSPTSTADLPGRPVSTGAQGRP